MQNRKIEWGLLNPKEINFRASESRGTDIIKNTVKEIEQSWRNAFELTNKAMSLDLLAQKNTLKVFEKDIQRVRETWKESRSTQESIRGTNTEESHAREILQKSEDLFWKAGMFYSSKEEDINLKKEYNQHKTDYEKLQRFMDELNDNQ